MKTIIKRFFNGLLVFYFFRLFVFAKRGFFTLYFWMRGVGLMGWSAMGACLLSGGLALSHSVASRIGRRIRFRAIQLERVKDPL